jgi:proteasome lid subunit RPN8/RPN11
MEPEIEKGHEGIAYLLGHSDGTNTLTVAAIRPHARTTQGSFAVGSLAMACVVRSAVDCGLQLVGQVHTHPGRAYHSGGDEDGARIAYSGYVSIVLPDYGRRLPRLDGAATYMFRAGAGFAALDQARITVVPARMP